MFSLIFKVLLLIVAVSSVKGDLLGDMVEAVDDFIDSFLDFLFGGWDWGRDASDKHALDKKKHHKDDPDKKKDDKDKPDKKKDDKKDDKKKDDKHDKKVEVHHLRDEKFKLSHGSESVWVELWDGTMTGFNNVSRTKSSTVKDEKGVIHVETHLAIDGLVMEYKAREKSKSRDFKSFELTSSEESSGEQSKTAHSRSSKESESGSREDSVSESTEVSESSFTARGEYKHMEIEMHFNFYGSCHTAVLRKFHLKHKSELKVDISKNSISKCFASEVDVRIARYFERDLKEFLKAFRELVDDLLPEFPFKEDH